jgi:hypothetical protein
VPSINLAVIGTGTSKAPSSVTGLSMRELNGGSPHVTPGAERFGDADAGRPAKRPRVGCVRDYTYKRSLLIFPQRGNERGTTTRRRCGMRPAESAAVHVLADARDAQLLWLYGSTAPPQGGVLAPGADGGRAADKGAFEVDDRVDAHGVSPAHGSCAYANRAT